jgi:hypothetical protein
MEQKFPLYTSLLSNIKPTKSGKYKDLTKSEKENFVSIVKTVNSSAHEIMYAIIASFCTDSTTDVPYSGTFVDSGVVEFNFNIFPPLLKRMLYNFIMLHVESTHNT